MTLHATREAAVVLVDGPALVHRWFHRWSYATKQGSTVDSKRFVIKNARFALARAHSFDPSHLAQNLLSPQVEYAHTPKHNKVIVCFDNGDGGRTELFPDYKKNRRQVARDPELSVMMKVAKRVFLEEPEGTILVLPDSNPRLKMINAEADDMIATIALRNQKYKVPTVVVSHDFDLYQLIDDNCKSYHYDIRTKYLVSEKGVIDRIGIHPKLVRDYKALAGDASDGVPGVKGIGKVRAQSLLKKYGDLDGVLTKGIKKETGRVGEILREGVKDAELSRKIVDFRLCPKIMPTVEQFMKK
ncbi:mitochondrial structure specific endonuclease I (SSE-1) [Angomonas deanei]|uniref:5'-3' exonuclease, N-terminal resolvase-like domain/5'-3' exonuclease, C-terminal SAM fold, putative n=1 Tax=Angomonas deanei TaxID=59799 RepID=S9UR69_9TRYP|nr:mitochondrial structure specific endonuclease I (SSE-1) [Angomonas deanei]EPY43332.1 mitochondrial structure specific endonuclease I (SSE-1) [Angomonas deanei]CAD2221081.1 5'-3' exonuclease, N-terminal resolvase-like domain/5'-3' exonuclease, C-terminal SAM fold, putative [Angomonas deanei]|eukprot:EPY31284.1 mitochondrial structure specific endonuclease I (SSE-1) [Angomonas deanei]